MAFSHLRITVFIFASLCLILSSQPAEGAAYSGGRKTAQTSRTPAASNVKRDAYVRIVFEDHSNLCVARTDDSVAYCSSSLSQPTLCSNGSSVEFVKKFVVLEGPEGQCLGGIEGDFNEEANFDRRKILGRLPILHQSKKLCHANLVDGRWLEFSQDPNSESRYRRPTPVQPVAVSYRRNDSPYAKFNLSAEPGLLCVERNDSKVVYCATRPREGPKCTGANFINFDYEYRILTQGDMSDCFMRNSGYYDLLVDIDGEDVLSALPTYERDLGGSCFQHAAIEGREFESFCASDGRRCRP